MPHGHADADFCIFLPPSSASSFCLQDPAVPLAINEISLNCIFAPYGFAEAVAPLKQSAAPSGHCGFCPFAFARRRRRAAPQIEDGLAKCPEGVPRWKPTRELLPPLRASRGCRPRLHVPCRGRTKELGEGGRRELGASNRFERICFHRSSLTELRITPPPPPPPLSLRWQEAQPWRLPPCPD